MQIAKSNVERFYPVVGVVENINMTLMILEAKMPQYFKGAFEEYYTGEGVMSKRNKNHEKKEVSQDVINMIKKNITYEYEFYNFCKQRLENQFRLLQLWIKTKWLKNCCCCSGYNSLEFVVEWVKNWTIYFIEVEKKELPDAEINTKLANVTKNIL